MGTTVTSAGTGSGIDFESVITAMVTSKKTSTIEKTNTKITDTNTEISAVSTFKSYLKTFKDSLTDLMSTSLYNTYAATTDQGSNNYFTVSTTSQAAAAEFDLTVKQLASSEKLTAKFDSNKHGLENGFEAGSMTISLGTDEDGNELGSYTFEVEDGDTIEEIRQKINKNDLGISCSLIATSTGYTMSLTDKLTGEGASSLTITTTPAESTDAETAEAEGTEGTEEAEGEEAAAESTSRASLDIFNASAKDDGYWNRTDAKDAVIVVDGEEISSNTNYFNENQVAGVSITVNKVSATKTIDNGDGTTSQGLASNHVTVAKSTATLADKMQNVCTQYNLLMTRLDDLGARNTYTDGVSNEDGGPLAGDSMVRGIKTQLQSMMSGFLKTTDSGESVYSMGLSYKKDGTLTLNATSFKAAVEKDPDAVYDLFGGDEGLLTNVDSFLKGYTKSAGYLDQRNDSLQNNVSYLQDKLDKQTTALESYETNLRKRYGAIDALIAGLNTNLTYLDSAMSGINANKS